MEREDQVVKTGIICSGLRICVIIYVLIFVYQNPFARFFSKNYQVTFILLVYFAIFIA